MIRKAMLPGAVVAILAASFGVAPVASGSVPPPIAVAQSGPLTAQGGVPSVPSAQVTQPAAAPGSIAAGDRQPLKVDLPPLTKNPKADWRIDAVAQAEQSGGASAALDKARSVGLTIRQGKVQVILETTDALGVARGLAAKGIKVGGSAGKLVEVSAAPGQLRALQGVAGVQYVRPPLPRVADAVVDEAVTSTNASTWQARGQSGAGVQVAIIDLGFSGYEAAQTSGDLPASVTTVDDCGGVLPTATNHGTAVAEIVHKMAPSAQLTLICVDTEVDLAAAEQYVKDNAIPIVNHSVSWFNSSRGDGSGAAGTPDAIVADAQAHGILWVNAAGNYALGHWNGTFVASNWYLNDGNDSPIHDFGGGDIGNNFTIASGDTVCAFLKWDAWPTTSEDYDLYLVRASDDMLVAASNDEQSGSQPPTEAACYTNPDSSGSYYALITQYYAAGRHSRLDLFISSGALQYQMAAGSITEPASSPKALAVGAACWSASTIENYSSRGPTIGNLIKPDLTGPDRVSTLTYGAANTCTSGGFGGTSASSPHVAGASALVLGAHPTYTAAQVQTYLQSQAQDLGTAGKDNTFGYGLMHLPTVPFAPGAPRAVQGSGGDRSAEISWTAPVTDGGSAVTGYTATAHPGGATCTTTGSLLCTITGLSFGTPYTFTVRATNSIGTGPASDPSSEVLTLPGPPLAPTVVTAVGGDSAATVSWTAADANGSAITAYTVTSSPEAKTCTNAGELLCTVTSLTNGTAYTFTVSATNGLGTSPSSAPSNSVVPAGPPLAPTDVSAIPYHQSALVSWSAAADNGAAVTGYTVTSSPEAKTCTTTGALSCTVTGLTDGKGYTFTVHAANAVGNGPESAASDAVTPLPVPEAPTSVTAIGLDGAAAVTWAGPADNGSAITGYTVTAAPGGLTCQTTTELTCKVDGLTNRTAYTFTVTATNAIGTGPASSPPAGATPLSGATYHAVAPARVLDTRTGNGLAGVFRANAARTFQVSGRGGVPAGAVAVTGNLTVVGQTASGYLYVGPAPMNSPTSSTLNFPLGDARANGVSVQLSATGTLSITYVAGAGKTAQAIFDVTGYYTQ